MQPDPPQLPDVELLHAVARGDEAALARLYDSYRVILFGLLVRILNSREEAEDVLQDVFIQVWRRAKDFDEKRGRPFTCTGDLPTALAMLILKKLTGVAMYTEVQVMDEKSRAVVIANSGEGEEGIRRKGAASG